MLGAKLDEGGRAGPRLKRRVARGAALFHDGAAPWLLLSGGTAGAPPAEADVMRTLALEAGVPADRVLLEDRSRTTWENAFFTARLMAERDLTSALLVTDRLHLPRARLTFRRAGLRVEGRAAETGWHDDPPGRIAAQLLYEAVAILRNLPRFAFGRTPN